MIDLNDYRQHKRNIIACAYKPYDYVRFVDDYDKICRGRIIQIIIGLDDIQYMIYNDDYGDMVEHIHAGVYEEQILGLVNED